MKACALCKRVDSGAPPARHWFGDFAGWVGFGGLFALAPKCPMCLAAYLAMATGIGLSVTAVTRFKAALLILCAVAVGAAITRWVRRYWLASRT